MGVTFVEGTVRGPGGEETVRFLVDSGAGYTSFFIESVLIPGVYRFP